MLPIQFRILSNRFCKAEFGLPLRWPLFLSEFQTSSSEVLICASIAKCRKVTPATESTGSPPLSIWLSRIAPLWVIAATRCLFVRSSSSGFGGSETNLSYSSAIWNSAEPVLKSICRFIFEPAIRYRRISGGTKFSASIGPTVLPEEEDIGPAPFT